VLTPSALLRQRHFICVQSFAHYQIGHTISSDTVRREMQAKCFASGRQVGGRRSGTFSAELGCFSGRIPNSKDAEQQVMFQFVIVRIAYPSHCILRTLWGYLFVISLRSASSRRPWRISSTKSATACETCESECNAQPAPAVGPEKTLRNVDAQKVLTIDGTVHNAANASSSRSF